MKRLFVVLTGVFLSCAWILSPCQGQGTESTTTIVVGAMDPAVDAGPMLRTKLAEAVTAPAPKELVLGNQTYSVRPASDGKYCFHINGARDLVVRGAGTQSKLMVTDPAAGVFDIQNATRVILRGFAIDYDPLPFTQGTIRAIDAGAKTYDIELDAGYPLLSDPQFAAAGSKFGAIMDRAARRIKTDSHDALFYSSWNLMSGRTFRVQSAELSNMAVGDAMYLLARSNSVSAVSFANCTDSGLGDLTVYASPSVACWSYGRGMKFTGFRVAFADASRLVSTDADGIHCPFNRTGPRIERCRLEGMADDGIIIHTLKAAVKTITSSTVVTATVPDGRMQILAGDRLQVFDTNTGQVRGILTVKSATRSWNDVRLTYTPALTLAASDVLYNLSESGADYVIAGNTIGKHRHVGIIVHNTGEISDNAVDGSSLIGIATINHYALDVGPVASDVTLRNNTVRNTGYAWNYQVNPAAIAVGSVKNHYTLTATRNSQRILLSGNRMERCWRNGIAIEGARDVTLENTTIDATEGPGTAGTCGILLEQCGGIRITGTRIIDPRAASRAGIRIRPSLDWGTAGVSISGSTYSLATGVPNVLDERPKTPYPSPTPAWTPVPTPTATPTRTPSPTRTPTRTPTPTSTPNPNNAVANWPVC